MNERGTPSIDGHSPDGLGTPRVRPISHAVILAAGSGTRMRPWTWAMPKAMLPLGRRPVIDFVLDEAHANGISHVTLVTSYHLDHGVSILRGETRRHWDDLTDRGAGISILEQSGAYPGLANAVLSAFSPSCLDEPDAPFVAMLADDIAWMGESDRPSGLITRMIDAYMSHDGPVEAVVAVKMVPMAVAHRYGIVSIGSRGVIRDVVEKPSHPLGTAAILGRYILGPGLCGHVMAVAEQWGDRIPPTGIELTWAIDHMIRKGPGEVIAVEMGDDEIWYDTGNISGYADAFSTFAAREVARESGS